MRYQQFASHAYCGAEGPVSKMAPQDEKAFCVPCFDVSRSVITAQCEFRARFKKKTHPTRIMYFFKPCTKLTLHCNHRSGAHRKPFRTTTPSWKLVPRPRSKHDKLGEFPLLAVCVVAV
jgi:hypothetical protein